MTGSKFPRAVMDGLMAPTNVTKIASKIDTKKKPPSLMPKTVTSCSSCTGSIFGTIRFRLYPSFFIALDNRVLVHHVSHPEGASPERTTS
jgi:hypothetical protein